MMSFLNAHSVFLFLLFVIVSLFRTPPMATTTCEPPPTMKAAPPPAPPCTTLTTVPLQEHQGELHLSAAVQAAQEPQPAEEPLFPLAPSPPLVAPRPATTPGPPPDCPTSATPSSTPSPVGARASSPRLTLPLWPATSQGTAASWTPLPSWPTTTMATPLITRPTAWVLPRLAWLPWRPAHPTKCMGWDLEWDPGWGVQGSVWVPGVLLPQDQRLDLGSTAAPLASPTPRNTLTTLTADTHRGCRLMCETETPHSLNEHEEAFYK